MHSEIFMREIEAIYAAHGKAFPAQKVCLAVFGRVRDLPDAFMVFAAKEMRDYTALPSNLGRELRRVLWPDWLDKNPRERARRAHAGCAGCRSGRAGPGFLYVWEKDGHAVLCRCACNAENPEQRGWTREALLRAGFLPDAPCASRAKGEGSRHGAQIGQDTATPGKNGRKHAFSA